MAEDKSNKSVSSTTPKKDNILRPNDPSNIQDFSSILKILGQKNQDPFSLKDLGQMVSKTIKDQVSILDKTLNKILKGIEISRIQSVVSDKVYMSGRWFDLAKPTTTGSYEFATKPSLKDIKSRTGQVGFSKKDSIDVKIVGMSPEIEKLLLGDKKEEISPPQLQRSGINKGTFKNLLRTGIIMTPLITALAELIPDALEKDNPFRSAALIPSKILSTVGLQIFGKTFEKIGAKFGEGMLGKFFGKTFLKKLPIIGAFFNIGSGLKRLYDGDTVGGLIDFLSGFANLIPVVGWPLSLAIDMLHTWGDIQDAKAQLRGEVGWKDKLNAWFGENARYIPGIGAFVHLGEAVGHFSMGEILDGVKSLTKMGVMGTPFAPLVYLFENLDDEEADVELGGFNISQTLRSIRNWFGENARYIPGIGSFVHLGEAFAHFSEENIPEGILSLAKAGLVSTGLLSPLVYLFENLDNSEDSVDSEGFSITDSIRNIKGALVKKINEFFVNILKMVVTKVKDIAPPGTEWIVNEGLDALGITDLLEANGSSNIIDVNSNNIKRFNNSPANAGENEEYLILQREQLEQTKNLLGRMEQMGNVNTVSNNSSNINNFNTEYGGSRRHKSDYRQQLRYSLGT